jgi:hypothetical protein
MATQVLILGHSFISRFYDFPRFNIRVGVNLNLNLNPHREQVFLRDYPGAKIDYINHNKYLHQSIFLLSIHMKRRKNNFKLIKILKIALN